MHKVAAANEIGDYSITEIAKRLHADSSNLRRHFRDSLNFHDKSNDYAAMSATEIEAEKENSREMF